MALPKRFQNLKKLAELVEPGSAWDIIYDDRTNFWTITNSDGSQKIISSFGGSAFEEIIIMFILEARNEVPNLIAALEIAMDALELLKRVENNGKS